VDFPLLDKEARTWCYCFTKDKWVAGGAINNGGIVLRWLRDMHVGEYSKEAREKGFNNVYELFDSYAKEIRPGSDGLLFFPYLTGQRSPHWRADARGVMYGLNLSHNKKHLVRAAMEGIIFNMFMIYNALVEQLRNPLRKIIANGGYAKSGVWLQIQADVFDKEILVAGVEEAAALGAAFLSMVGIGAKRLIKEEALPAMRAKRAIEPIKENVEIYKNVYRNFIELYNLIFKNSWEVKNERDNN
jgi:gluconokinase